MEKMTNVKALQYILNNCKTLPEDVLAKVKAMKESYEKKADNKKPTKTQEENATFKVAILDTLKALGKPVTVTDLQKADASLGELSNQRVSALLKLLKDEGLVEKTVDKKKSFFSVVATIEEEDEADEQVEADEAEVEADEQ